MKKVLIFCFVTMLISSAVFAEDTDLLEKETGDETNQVEKAEEKIEKIHYPSYKEVGKAIQSLGSNLKSKALVDCLKTLDIDNQKNVIKLFNKFFDKTKSVSKKGDSREATRLKSELNKSKKTYGKLAKEENENFVVLYPKDLKFKISSKETTEFDAGTLLSAAENSFSKMTEMLLMTKFMYWPGKARGKIYVVPNIEMWKLIKKGITKKQPVQTVIIKPETREFFVLVTQKTYQEAEQAVAYAVAKATLNEYSEVVSGNRKSSFPSFFIIGAAATAADLNSVLTIDDGPQQVEKYKGKKLTARMLRDMKEKGHPLSPFPLYENKLFDIKDIIGKQYPDNKNEKVYYFMRQSAAVVSYLQQNGTLPFLVLTKELADGKGFKKSFDGYVDLRDELSGKTKETKGNKKDKKSRKERKKEQKDKKAAENCLDGYKEFMDKNNAKIAIFDPLTFEVLIEDKKEEAKDKKSSRSSKRRGGRKRR